MIESVQVGASSVVQTLIEGKQRDEQVEISQKVEREIQIFLKKEIPSSTDVVTFCSHLATIFDPGVVASHYVYHKLLFVFLDVVPTDVKSKFIYMPHSSRMH